MILSFFFATVLLNVESVFASACYFPDGSINSFEPCMETTGSSICCSQKAGDICLSNGLCFDPVYDKPYRGACTDSTWKADECSKTWCIGNNTFTSSSYSASTSSYEYLTQCVGTKYCCGTDSDCCDQPSLVFDIGTPSIVRYFGTITSGLALATVSSSASTSSSTRSSSSSLSPASKSTTSATPSSSSTPLFIGIAIGAVLFILLIAAVVLACCCLRRRRAQRLQAQNGPGNVTLTNLSHPLPPGSSYSHHVPVDSKLDHHAHSPVPSVATPTTAWDPMHQQHPQYQQHPYPSKEPLPAYAPPQRPDYYHPPHMDAHGAATPEADSSPATASSAFYVPPPKGADGQVVSEVESAQVMRPGLAPLLPGAQGQGGAGLLAGQVLQQQQPLQQHQQQHQQQQQQQQQQPQQQQQGQFNFGFVPSPNQSRPVEVSGITARPTQLNGHNVYEMA